MAVQHTILVPVSNNPASMEAVTIACTIGKARKSKVYAVHVIEVNRSIALNSDLESEARRGEQILRRAEEAASHAGYPITGELLQARQAGQAILDEARDRAVDAVIIGVGFAPVIGEFYLGRTAQFVLKHAECDVLIARQGTRPHAHEGEE
jgi:nucleotide-binding universal stress UspA family protein